MLKKRLLLLNLSLCIYTSSAFAGSVEVLHFWTSGSEAAALDILKQQIADDGHQWKDFVIAGGGGGNAKEELQQRVLKGNPPAAAQIKGLDIQRWARLGFLADLNGFANEERWDDKLPKVVANAMKYNGQYVAVPVNVHRTNWLWANKPLLDRLNIAPPKTWEEFDQAALKIQNAGFRVLAQGNQAWQNATLFETVALSVGGADYYRAAFVEHDFSVLKGSTSEAVFERFNKLVNWMSFDAGEEWTQATDSVINGEAAFQIMGDWAKGEFLKAGKTPNRDFYCVAVPGTENKFLFNIDSFAIFRLRNSDSGQTQAQGALVRNIMSDSFQLAFNLNKGSIPARTDMSMSQFDACGRQSMIEFLNSDMNNDLVPSIAHGMSTTSTVQQYFFDKIQELTENPIAPDESARQLSKAIRYGQYILK